MYKRRSNTLLPILALIAILVPASIASAIRPQESQTKQARNFDARIELTQNLSASPSPAQRNAERRLGASVKSLSVRYDAATGAARTISSHTTYLTEAVPAESSALELGLAFAQANADLLGLSVADLENHEVTSNVFTQATGATHVYLRQTHGGLPLYNGQLQFNVNRDGRLISVNNAFLPNLAAAVNTLTPTLDAAAAVAAAAEHLGLGSSLAPRISSAPRGPQQLTRIDNAEISAEPIEARLMLLPIRAGEARLVWNFQIYTTDSQHIFDLNVDAVSAKVWTRFDWVNNAQYRVYEQPVADPEATTPPPPADARTLAVDPFDVGNSPFGWHDTDGTAGAEFTIHRGNNVHAYEDRDGNNSPPATQVDCGGALNCDFPLDLSMAPSVSVDAAVTNLFYWNNIIHDIQYHYGFDEMGGNFQFNLYGAGGGAGGDDVQAEALDNDIGGSNCNANFGTPPDGQRPRMQMFRCNMATPSRDGDYDAVVIAHEYGHGISNRQVGGPTNTSCLGTTQQPGEGWSDWLGLVYTALPTDLGTDARTIGGYLFNNGGIRDLPYSTDPAVNPWTYEDIAGAAVPHGVGSRWAQVIWDVYWALVDQYGFDANLYDAAGGSGNQRAMLYINEGLKDTACGPSFLDTRDGVIQAAVDNFGGADVCILWEAFAAFGLGTDAVSPSPNSTAVTNGFALPVECIAEFSMAVVDTHEGVCAPVDATYNIDIGNNGSVEPVTLSVAPVPAGASSAFSVNPVTPVGSSVLTISGTASAAPGSYMMSVSGTNSTGTIGIDLTLDISNAVPGAATLTAPVDNEVGTPTAPNFMWNAATQGLTYLLEVADDAAFSNIVFSVTVAGTSHASMTNLDPDTEYFWRVTASNDCGTGGTSTVFSFTTANELCFAASLSVPDNVPAGVTDTQVILTGGELTDINVRLDMTHTFLGDLRFTLTHMDTGTSVVIFDRPGGCSGNDMTAELDDEATDPLACTNGNTPAIDGFFVPANPLSAFDGEDLSGTWVINVSDNAGIDTGTLNEWCLISGIVPTIPPMFTDGFESGDTSAWSASAP